MKCIEVTLPISFDELSDETLFYVALESGQIDEAMVRMGRLGDPRTLKPAAVAMGALALEQGNHLLLLDMVELVDDPKLRFGWLLEILEKGDPNDVDTDVIIATMSSELDKINDGAFLDRAREALDDLVERSREPMISLAGYFDPDIAGLTLLPSLG